MRPFDRPARPSFLLSTRPPVDRASPSMPLVPPHFPASFRAAAPTAEFLLGLAGLTDKGLVARRGFLVVSSCPVPSCFSRRWLAACLGHKHKKKRGRGEESSQTTGFKLWPLIYVGLDPGRGHSYMLLSSLRSPSGSGTDEPLSLGHTPFQPWIRQLPMPVPPLYRCGHVRG